MKADAFILASGLVDNVEWGSKAADALADVAEQFLRIGGTVSIAEFGQLSAGSRLALQTAAKRIEAQRADIVAGAIVRAVGDISSGAAKEGAEDAARILVEGMEL